MSLSSTDERDPFTGIWKLNLSKSKLAARQPRSQTGHIAVDGPTIRIREDVVNEDGTELQITVDAKLDGTFYPVTGTPMADSVAYLRVDRHTITGKAMKNGELINEEKAVVAEDGRSMTVTYKSKAGISVGVFDKKKLASP